MNGVTRAYRYIDKALERGNNNFPETIKQAARRFKADEKRKDIYFDEEAANFACSFLEQMPHTKGTLQGEKLRLEDWQCFFVANLFGWKDSETGFRRFRYFVLIVPRKNGKTALAIGIGYLMFAPDNEPGAEIYFGATGEKHAKRLLFKPAKYLADNWEGLAETFNIEAGASSIVRSDNDSLMTTVIRNPGDGDSPHLAIVDEYHEHKDSDQYDTFKSGMGGRDQPMLGVITTAGSNLGSPCKLERDECLKILKGQIESDDKFIQIYEPDEEDFENWQDVDVLRKVNPNMGVSVTEKYLLSELETAKQSPTKQSLYKTKHLDMWVGSKSPWMNMAKWDAQASKLKIHEFAGEPCHIACDLASKLDLTVIHVTFKRDGVYYGFPYFFAPEQAIKNNDMYKRYLDSGELIETPDVRTDYEFIEEKIKELAKTFEVRSIAFDPFQATSTINRLLDYEDFGDKVYEMTMNVKNLSDPMKELQSLIESKEYKHDGNQCMTWNIGNTVARLDAKDNIYPRKENDDDKRCKIDGTVASIMGMARWLQDDLEDNVDMDDLIDNMII